MKHGLQSTREAVLWYLLVQIPMFAADPLGPVSCELEIPWILGLQLGNLGVESTSQTFLIPFYQHELFLQFEQQQLVCWWAGLRSPRDSVSLGRP